MKKVYVSEAEGPRRRRRRRRKPVVKWKDRVKEYMHESVANREGGLNKQGGSVWIRRDGGSSADEE